MSNIFVPALILLPLRQQVDAQDAKKSSDEILFIAAVDDVHFDRLGELNLAMNHFGPSHIAEVAVAQAVSFSNTARHSLQGICGFRAIRDDRETCRG